MAYEGVDELGKTMLENQRRWEKRRDAEFAFRDAPPDYGQTASTTATQAAKPNVLARLKGAASKSGRVLGAGYGAYEIGGAGMDMAQNGVNLANSDRAITGAAISALASPTTAIPATGYLVGRNAADVVPDSFYETIIESADRLKEYLGYEPWMPKSDIQLTPEAQAFAKTLKQDARGNYLPPSAATEKTEPSNDRLSGGGDGQQTPNLVVPRASQTGMTPVGKVSEMPWPDNRKVLADTLLRNALANMEKYADPNRQLGTGRGLRQLADLQATLAGNNINATPESIAKTTAPDFDIKEVGGGINPVTGMPESKRLAVINKKTGAIEFMDPGVTSDTIKSKPVPTEQDKLMLKQNPALLKFYIEKFGEEAVPEWAKKTEAV